MQGNAATTPPPKPSGFLERLRAATPKIITDNAPRIVGALKITGSYFMTGSENKLFKVAGIHFMTANGIMALFGGKKTEEQKEKLRQESAGQKQTGLLGHIGKVFQPHKYPIESAATVSTVGSLFWTAAGVTGGNTSFGRLLAGLTSLGSDANAAFTKEKIGVPDANPHEKGTPAYYFTELKNRPVLVSSSLNLLSDISSMTFGAYEYFVKGKEPQNLLAGSFLFMANLFQAIFVNKNDYNIEAIGAASGAPKTDAAAPPPPRRPPWPKPGKPPLSPPPDPTGWYAPNPRTPWRPAAPLTK